MQTKYSTPRQRRPACFETAASKWQPAATACLAKSPWPCAPKYVNVSICDLDTAAMSYLGTKDWPNLQTLHLSAKSRLDTAAAEIVAV